MRSGSKVCTQRLLYPRGILLPLFVALSIFASAVSVARAEPNERCARIVSLAPSVTETLFALDLGRNVVGVSRFCNFPAQVTSLPRIGGLLDPNFEGILSLKPSVVVSLTEFRERTDELKKLSLPSLVVDQRRIPDILDSILTLGEYCGRTDAAAKVRAAIESDVERVATRAHHTSKVRTLLVVGSDEVGSLKNLYVSGNDGFYDALISAAGGVNVISNETKTVTALSLESVISLNPEVIIQIHPDIKDAREGRRKALRAWQPFFSIPAVRDGRIHVLGADYTYIPGPRFPKLLEVLASLLHPELFSSSDAAQS